MSEYVVEIEYDTINGTFSQKRHEEIVRCRDCEYASYDSRWCYRLLNAEEPPTTPDGFCAWGKRK